MLGTGALSGPLQVDGVSAAPFPRVVEVEHGQHVALAEFGHQIVEAVEDGVVVDARRRLQRGLHTRADAVLAVGAHKDAQVADTDALERVELAGQAFAVAARALRGKDGAIPEVGAHIVVGHAVADKPSVFDVHKGRLLVARLRAAGAADGKCGCKHTE